MITVSDIQICESLLTTCWNSIKMYKRVKFSRVVELLGGEVARWISRKNGVHSSAQELITRWSINPNISV